MVGRGKLRKPGAIVAASAAVLSMGGALLGITAGTAAAAAPTAITLAPPGTAPATIGQASTGPVPTLSFPITGAVPGDVLRIDLTNGTDPTRQVYFSSVPSVYEAPAPTAQTGPQFTVALATNPADPPGVTVTDELDITVTAAATDGSTYTVYIGALPTFVSGAVHSGGAATSTALDLTTTGNAALGPVTPTASYTTGGVTTPVTIPTIATIGTGQITANTPPIAIPDIGATSYPISPVTYREAAPGQLGATATAGTPVTVTLALDSPAGETIVFDPASSPVLTVTGGGAGSYGPATVTTAGTITFKVFSPSVLAPNTFTISGLKVDAHATPGPLLANGAIIATLTESSGGPIAGVPVGGFEVAGISAVPPAIAGADADGTAIAVLDARFPPGDFCVPNGAVVLARDDFFADALSASYLAQYLHTGILLTPSGTLSAETQNELKLEGVSTVYIVGGPDAIVPAVATAIDNLPVYNCGGTAAVALNTKVATVRVFGETEYGTAAAVAEYPTPLPTSNFIDLSAAFAHSGNYNDTTGTESTTPPGIAQNTAIVASGTGFPDAATGSTLAYRDGIPILLTDPGSLSPETQAALTSLGIKQVILLGGPDAVSNTVEGQLSSTTGLNLTVLRIAGQDATDTAQLLAQFEVNTPLLGFNAPSPEFSTVFIARGDFYTDALTASSYLGFIGQPLLLTENPSTLGPYLTSYLNAAGAAGATQVQAFGGPLAVNPSTISAADAAIAAG
jgi:putative cell wall-binding protein